VLQVLWSPLLALEVVDTVVVGSMLVVACKLNPNMMSLSLRQLVSRRRTIVGDMAGQMQLQARFKLEDARGDAWGEVRKLEGGMEAVTRFINSFMGVATHEPTYYNVDEQLGDAVLDAVALSKILEAWPAGLRALASRESKGERVADLVPGDDGIFRLAEEKGVSDEEVHGLVALAWIQEKLATLDLSERTLSPEGVVALARALPPSLTSLMLKKCDIAKDGKDLKGVEQIGLALRNPLCALQTLDCEENKMGPLGAALIAKGLQKNASLRSLRYAPTLRDLTRCMRPVSAVNSR